MKKDISMAKVVYVAWVISGILSVLTFVLYF